MSVPRECEAGPFTVIESAVQKLREEIVSGALQPGAKLVEADLCRALAVSRASLREALRALHAERLVAMIPNRGTFVAKLDAQEIDHIHDVWAMLTGEAVARFATLAGVDDLTRLSRVVSRLRAQMRTGDAVGQLRAINSFFRAILYGCGNPIFAELVETLVSRINFLRVHALRQEGWRLLCFREIEGVLAGLISRDPGAAADALRRHIDSACAAARDAARETALPTIRAARTS